MALLHRRDKIPTYIYVDNYGYKRNTSNQPMKDYLVSKSKGENPQYPHSLWSNERASSDKLKVLDYTKSDAKNLLNENTKNSERYTGNDKVITRISSTTVTNSELGSRLKRHIHLPTFEEALIRKIQDREDQRRIASIMDDMEAIKVRFNANKDVHLSTSLKSSIRGKSANQITAALLADSEKNIRESKNREIVHMNSSAQSRGISESRIVKRTTHIELIDDRMLDQLDQSMSSSLYDVKKQLQNFNQRSEDLYHNSRWRKSYFK